MRETNRNNKKLYRDTFDQITLSEDAYRAIRNMEETNMEHKNKKFKTGYAIAVSLAALAVVFCSANGIAYAATGTSLTKRIAESELLGQVSVYINGEPAKKAEVNTYQEEDGSITYELHPDGDEGSGSVTILEEPEASSEDSNSKRSIIYDTEKKKNNSTASITIMEGKLETKTKKTSAKDKEEIVYLVVADEKKIDITEDFAEDGVASGTFQMDGTGYQYLVEGTIEDYSVSFSFAK